MQGSRYNAQSLPAGPSGPTFCVADQPLGAVTGWPADHSGVVRIEPWGMPDWAAIGEPGPGHGAVTLHFQKQFASSEWSDEAEAAAVSASQPSEAAAGPGGDTGDDAAGQPVFAVARFPGQVRSLTSRPGASFSHNQGIFSGPASESLQKACPDPQGSTWSSGPLLVGHLESTLKIWGLGPGQVAQWVRVSSQFTKVSGWIPGQGTYRNQSMNA